MLVGLTSVGPTIENIYIFNLKGVKLLSLVKILKVKYIFYLMVSTLKLVLQVKPLNRELFNYLQVVQKEYFV
nr:MAG TPA: hypothetical protein [Caudoviricetes sp.]